MALVVNTNVPALNAQRNLETSGIQLNRALQRLSSGLRVNSAADDAAGLAISTRLGAQVRGLNQAIRNANDGVGILQTAEGALSEITNIVTRIKELSVQSANGTNSTSDRGSLNAEVQSLISEVTRIATQTKFGSTAILDGSFSAAFQVGTEAGQTVSATVANYKASALSGSVASQTLTFQADVDAVGAADANTYLGVDSSTDLQVSGPKGAAFARATTASDDTASFLEGARSGVAVAKVINEISSTTGVVATAQAATYTTGGAFANAIDIDGTTNTLSVNGQNVVVNLNGGTAAARRQQFIDAVNSQVSGVTAAAGSGTSVVLTAADGRNISLAANGAAANTTGGEVFGFTTAVSTESVVARGSVRLQAAGTITTTLGDAATQAQVGGEGTTAATSTTLISLNISTVSGASTALLVADAILDTISSGRGDLGALQNRLTSTVANLGVVSEKVSEARSRILDADFAAETAALTKGQILQQAGIAILSQANSQPQAVLSLLRGQ
jgi:flagellin